MIGVGEDNQFGHPTSIVLDRLQNLGVKIYRTDINGEIILKINKKGNIKINVEVDNNI